jgi:GT2 family glycosyltransferase
VAGADRSFELRGELPAGWIELDVELPEGAEAPLRVIVAGEAQLLPPARAGHVRALLEVPPGATVGLQQAEDGPALQLGRIVAREVGRTEAALRRAAPVVWKRLREPGTIPSATMKILRAVRRGELLDRLLRRGGGSPQQAFYPEWHARYGALGAADRHAIQAAVEQMRDRPRISVLLPVCDPPDRWLARAIDCVRAQLYPDWELCIADDASQRPGVREMLEKVAADEPRVRLVFRQERGGMSAACNSALAHASGSFVTFLDPGDELAEHALYLLADDLGKNPQADLLYSDEDEIDERGRPQKPFFKPDWNPDLLLGQDYVARLCALRASLVRELGGFRAGYEGSHGYDLVLRASARTDPQRIRHLPFVLYHRRAIAGPAAEDAKPPAEEAGLRALRDHLGAAARADPGPLPGTQRVRLPLPADPPLVTVIIPTRDGRSLLEPCVESLLAKTSYRAFELLIVDNQTRDRATLDYFAQLERWGVARVAAFDRPFNFSALNNFAVRERARGALVALLNNDLEIVEPEWLGEMVSHAVRPEIGAVGARLLHPDGTLQHGGIVLGIAGAAGYEQRFLPRGAPGYFGRAQLVHDVSAVTAACLVIRRETWLRAKGMDESFPVALNDVDFCLRVRALGLRNLWTPFATLIHHESKSRGQEDTPAKKARFAEDKRRLEERWGEALRADPAYNPNLSLDAEDFSLAWPPRVARPWLEPPR